MPNQSANYASAQPDATLPHVCFLRAGILRGFRHAFSTRRAGDFALRCPERAAAEALLCSNLELLPSRLRQVTQVHGACIVDVARESFPCEATEADGLYAPPSADCAVAVRVADCVPVLLADSETGAVAAVHAGWRGLELQIVRAAVARLRLTSSAAGTRSPGAAAPASALRAAIGPCIGGCCFEVSVDVATRIVRASHPSVQCASGVTSLQRFATDERRMIDLRKAVRVQLLAEGLADSQIEDVGGCTRCEPLDYWSHRREGAASGRLIAAIVAG